VGPAVDVGLDAAVDVDVNAGIDPAWTQARTRLWI
jgi:hypothetical protein